MGTRDPGRWSVLLVVILLAVSFVTGGSRSSAGASASPALVSPDGAGACQLPVPSSGVRGELTIDGGPLPPTAAAGIAFTYSYGTRFQTVETPGNILLDSGCVRAKGTTTTASNGSFSFVPPTPPTSCIGLNGAEACTSYNGTFVPVNLSLSDGTPAGYVLQVNGSAGSIGAALIYELESVTISPAGLLVTTSVGAPTGFSAAAWMANGSETGLDVTFAWSVNGTGWSFDGAAVGPSVNLTGLDGSAIAVVTVRANASVHGVELTPVEATVDALPIATTIETGDVNKTLLDVGGSVEVELTASGAAGFSYRASIEPGLGLPQVTAPCRTGPAGAGSVDVFCAATVSYPSAGTAQPTANLTNGYSSASWRFPNVVVDPPPSLEVDPGTPVGYALAPIPITVTVANGSGAPPYVRACLEVQGGPTLCRVSSGPVWWFSPILTQPGTYTATASVLDTDGTNVSLPFTLEVVPALAVGPVTSSAPNATVDAPVALGATVSGGVLPLRFWWNLSGPPGPLLDGVLPSDGNLSATYVPAASGPVMVTLTVIDRLGTVVASELLLSIGPAAAVRIAPVTAPPAGPVLVGEPVPVAWAAFDVSGAIDTSFEAAVDLTLTPSVGAPRAWVNASGIGPLAALGRNEFGVPPNGWVDGVLDVNVTIATAGEVAIGLSGTALSNAVAPMGLLVEPDRNHVRLFSPMVVRPGDRTNTTLWRVEDRYGNPVPGALLTIDLSFGGERRADVVVAIALPGGGSGVWVNYSALTGGTGEVTIVDGAGTVVLGPLPVPPAPAPPSSTPAVAALATVVPAGVIGAATFAVIRRRRRAREAHPGEEDLRRLAEGRARAIDLIGRAGAIDLAGLEEAWGRPVPPALADWLASLVADGSVRATLGEDGRPRFCLADGGTRAPQVTLDPQALDQSLRHREEALVERGSGPEERAG